VLASVFCDKDGILPLDYLLNKLKLQLVSKCEGELSKGISFRQDNAPHKAVIKKATGRGGL
jgi:hypothetical protein